jgi:hypothetical protein
LERLKQGKYNKSHWLRYIRGHEPPGPTEEEEEEEEEEATYSGFVSVVVVSQHAKLVCLITLPSVACPAIL